MDYRIEDNNQVNRLEVEGIIFIFSVGIFILMGFRIKPSSIIQMVLGVMGIQLANTASIYQMLS